MSSAFAPRTRSCALGICLSIGAAALAGTPPGTPSEEPSDRSPAEGSPGVHRVEDIFDSAPFAECHASSIAETEHGLVVAFFGGTEEGHADVGIWVSRSLEARWTAPVEIADGVQHADLRYPSWNPVLWNAGDGRLLLFYKVGPSPSAWWGQRTESRDAGETWDEPRRLPETILGPVRNKPVRLENGALLCGSSTEHDGWRVHFEITPDLGRTWKRVGPVNDGKEWGAIQPTILRLRDGRFRALCRSRQGRIVSVDSSDGGATWSAMQPTLLPNPNSGIDAVTLTDGRHLLVYNHTVRNGTPSPRGREMLNIAVSDDGATWQAALVLERSRGEYSYPAVVQSTDGLVHVTYTWRRRRIRHVVLDPKKLELAPLVDGRWPDELEAKGR